MPGVLQEDQEFTPKTYFLAKRFMYHRRCLYHYFQRPGSIQKSKNPKKTMDCLKICESLKTFADEKLCEDSQAYDTMMRQIAFCFSQSLAHYSPGEQGHSIARLKACTAYPLVIPHSLPLNARIKYHLINISLRGYLTLYRLSHSAQ